MAKKRASQIIRRNTLRATLLSVTKAAGKVIRDGLKREVKIQYKGEINLVTEIDRQSEDLIVKTIRSRFPEHGIIAEEGSLLESRSPYRWIIDPLDGTTNYAHRFPFFCVSIGLEFEGEMCLGVVYNPVLAELFFAERGKGATLNGKPIGVSPTSSLSQALLVTGFAYDCRVTKENNMNHFSDFTLQSQGVRRTGSAALDLSYVACGRFDGFWERRLNPWDVAAGSLLVREAGGEVSSFSGDRFRVDSKEILASNGKIHHAMISVLHPRA